jgi:hypothetical protein
MNIVLITDSNGDTVDVNCYCSDFCAQTDPLYQGWFGCVPAAYDTTCLACAEPIKGETSFHEFLWGAWGE